MKNKRLLKNALALVISVITLPSFASDMSGTYHLKTQFRGDGECLEGNQAASSAHSGAAFMATCQNVSGQIWNIESAGNGFYRLKTEFRGTGECLEGNEAASPVHNGAAFMDQCKNVSGQLWKFESAGNGLYRLKTMFRGEGECLEGNQAASNVHSGAAFMAKCQNVSGQLWKLEKAGGASLPGYSKVTNLSQLTNGMPLQFRNPKTGKFIVLKNDPRGGGTLVVSNNLEPKGWQVYKASGAAQDNLEVKRKDITGFNWSNYPGRGADVGGIAWNHAKRNPNATTPAAPHDWKLVPAGGGNFKIQWTHNSGFITIIEGVKSHLGGNEDKVAVVSSGHPVELQVWELYTQ